MDSKYISIAIASDVEKVSNNDIYSIGDTVMVSDWNNENTIIGTLIEIGETEASSTYIVIENDKRIKMFAVLDGISEIKKIR